MLMVYMVNQSISYGGSGSASTGMSPFWILLKLSTIEEVVVTTGAIRHAKLQSNRHHQQTNIPLFTGLMPFCRPTNSVKALKEAYHIMA